MKWIVTENETGICSGLTMDDLPDTLPPNIHILRQNGQLAVLSENVAGVLPCKHGNEITIEPKCKDLQPIEMLLYINNASGIAVNRERVYEGKSTVSINTLADAFLEQLVIIRANALKFKRAPQQVTAPVVKGKVDWRKTVTSRGKGTDEVFTTVRVASTDIPENALIAAAAEKISPLFVPSTPEYTILLPWIKLANENRHTYRELFAMQKTLTETSLSGAHAFYYAPVVLAKMILGFLGAETYAEENDTILFNMPGLYEEFIRTGFRRAGSKYRLSVQKNFIPRSFLFCDGECELVPDITIYDGSSIKALLDVKYKVPDSKDFYQIFAYMKYANVSTAYIISPLVQNEKMITAFSGEKIVFVKVDNCNPIELERAAEKIIREVK